MARLLVTRDSHWYDQLNSVGYYGETAFERNLKQHLHSIFPDYIGFSYKRDVDDGTGDVRRPDLALIRKNYEDWWIVEVELEAHSLDHVLGQTKVFRYGDYNAPETTDYICAQALREAHKRLTKAKVQRLIARRPPSILVVVDAEKANWAQKLSTIGVQLCLFEVYKSTKGFHAYRLDGEYPVLVSAEAHCSFDRRLNNMLSINSKTFFHGLRRKEIDLRFSGMLTRWRVLRDAGVTYLKFIGKVNPIPPDGTYVICRDVRNKYHIRKN
jgi:hypothetical protein